MKLLFAYYELFIYSLGIQKKHEQRYIASPLHRSLTTWSVRCSIDPTASKASRFDSYRASINN